MEDVPQLETRRLILRPLQLEDAEQVQALFPQWEIVRYLTARVPWPYPEDGAAANMVETLAGDRSPACSAIVQPFRDGRSLTSAFTYFPACSQVCVRAKHDRSSPIRADLSRTARRAPILAAAAALSSFVSTNT